MKYIIRPLSLLAVFFLAGCLSIFPDKEQDTVQYDLPLPSLDAPKTIPRTQDVLKIGNISCAQPLATSRILVRTQKNNLIQDEPLADALWSEPLPDLITHRVIQALTRSRLYKGVIQNNDPIEATYLLSATVNAFDLRPTSAGLEAHVDITFLLTLQKERRLLKSHTFQVVIPSSSRTTQAALGALSQAFGQVLNDLSPWLMEKETSF